MTYSPSVSIGLFQRPDINHTHNEYDLQAEFADSPDRVMLGTNRLS